MISRQEYNWKILNLLIEKDYLEQASGICDKIEECIETYPQQRFGQIICNYICWDYRDKVLSDFTKIFMSNVFPIDFDPFYEESSETYERLINGK